MESNAVTVYENTQSALKPAEMKAQVVLIQQVMKEVMKDGEHYGVVPGTSGKPSLLKPGAEKLSFTFRMAPRYTVERLDFDNGHREYIVTCDLVHIQTGAFLGSGVGSCSTMEGKYRYRTGPTELTEKPVPKEYWDMRKSDPPKAQTLIGGKGFTAKKNESGQWVIAIQGEKVEHDNPADYYNTVLKMAKKRAHVDAVLTATAASDIFTQDVEDMPEVIPGAAQPPQPIAPEKPSVQPPQANKATPQGSPTIKDPGSPASEAQIKAIHAMLRKAYGDLKEEDKHVAVAQIIEGFTSFKELTKGQASAVIEALNVEIAGNAA